MEEYLGNEQEEPYSAWYMKTKLKEHYGDEIVITQLNGKPNVVTFRRTAQSIISDFFLQPKNEDCETEKIRIVETAAKLIKNDIKGLDVINDNYPTSNEMASIDKAIEFIPKLLQHFLSILVVGKDIGLKLASIGQAIMQATRPRVILAPLQLGLSIEMHHHFASRFLVDSLHSHGFCSSYSIVQNFERSAAATQGTDIPGYTPERFIQYVADNVDHNTRSLDGTDTFHGMGIIATVTPNTTTSKPVPKKTVTGAEIAAVGRIDIRHYMSQNASIPSMLYKELKDMKVQDATSNLDLLWKLTQSLLQTPRPAWAGMMQMVHTSEYPGKSSVIFLPMIDMDPSNMSCIYSTLTFICAQARHYGVTPIVTFD
ncbi:hypothetical protein QZH41_001487 [Actinostola sp. cb2023]|nr:hypothetical protein QZH41_001487 [Actinostola sp. cb2023]